MKDLKISCLCWFFVLLITVPACRSLGPCDRHNYDELKTMLDGLTKKAQVAVEEGYLQKGEKESLAYIKSLNPGAYNWFVENDYQIKLADVAGHAVVLICKDSNLLFEDTDCVPNGEPDKNHTNDPAPVPCEITMTPEEVNAICAY